MPDRLLALVPVEAVNDLSAVAGWVLVDPDSPWLPLPTSLPTDRSPLPSDPPPGRLPSDAPGRLLADASAVPVQVDRDRRTVTVAGRSVDLTYTEFEILATLTRHAGVAVSREQLARLVWPGDAPASTAAKGLTVHVHRLRRKLGADVAGRIRTLRGYGYRYDAA